MRVAVSGSGGLIGRALRSFMLGREDTVLQLVREDAGHPIRRDTDVNWWPMEGRVETEKLGKLDAAVHLAGAGVADKRWSEPRKKVITDSRVVGTRTLCEALAALEHKPSVLVCASAVGYYGDRGDETITEDAAPGEGFLADVCRQWEAATAPAAEAGIRVVNLRIGIVLAHDGGALQKMLPVFRMGLGGKLGNGRQYMPWITLSDTVDAIVHCIETPSLTGPVNCTAPNPVTNAEFTRTLARVLRRPAIIPVPGFLLRLALGQFAREALLAGVRAVPDALTRTGFPFRHDRLEPALRSVLTPRPADG